MLHVMQVTSTQVDKTLASLCRDVPRSVVIAGTSRPVALPIDAVARVTDLPMVRRDRAELARDRLAEDGMPSAETLAEKLIGRLVCDRLR